MPVIFLWSAIFMGVSALVVLFNLTDSSEYSWKPKNPHGIALLSIWATVMLITALYILWTYYMGWFKV